MATITLNIDENISDRVLEAVSSNQGYTEEIRNIEGDNPPYVPNPQTRLEFVTEWLKRKLIAEVAKCEQRKASEAASAAVESEISIT